MEYFKSIRELAVMAIRDKGVIPSYQARFDEMAAIYEKLGEIKNEKTGIRD